MRCRFRVRIAVRPFGVHIDEAHLNRSQRVVQLTLAAVAVGVAEPGLLHAPVDVLGFPDVDPAAAESGRLESHGLQCHIAGQDDEVCPGQLAPVLGLDRPQQSPCLVEVCVVGPAVQRRQALGAAAGAATAVLDAVGPGAVPGHPDEQRSVVPVVGRPPVLRLGHEGSQVGHHGFEVQLLELGGVVEGLAHGVHGGAVLTQDAEIQRVRPPVPDGGPLSGLAGHRALTVVPHQGPPLC